MRPLASLGGTLLLLYACATPAPQITRCDTLAASPTDPDRIAAGVADDDIDAAAAIAACRDAIAEAPGTARFHYQQGRALQVTENHAAAAAGLREAADGGYVQAMLHLASMHLYGELGRPDSESAKHWLLQAEKSGSLGAQWLLGWMYDTGYGIPQDYARAADWYRKAAERGHILARNALGWLYAKGRGVPRDLRLASQWYDSVWSVDDLTNNEVIRNFEIVSFALNEGTIEPFTEIHKWRSPVRIIAIPLFEGHGLPDGRSRFNRYRRMADEVVDSLSKQADMDIRLYEKDEITGDKANALLIFVDNINERVDGKPVPRLVIEEIRKRAGSDPLENLVSTPRNICSLYPGYTDGVINGAIIFITSDMHDDFVHACLVEELTQMLGLFGDGDEVMPSIFNDSSPFRDRTDHDDLLLHLLYDERITPGMPRNEAVAMARKILEERRPGR